jgi:hypothetical protein
VAGDGECADDGAGRTLAASCVVVDGNEFQRGEGSKDEVKKNFRWGVVDVKSCIFAATQKQTRNERS